MISKQSLSPHPALGFLSALSFSNSNLLSFTEATEKHWSPSADACVLPRLPKQDYSCLSVSVSDESAVKLSFMERRKTMKGEKVKKGECEIVVAGQKIAKGIFIVQNQGIVTGKKIWWRSTDSVTKGGHTAKKVRDKKL